jgi:hypothetical protein
VTDRMTSIVPTKYVESLLSVVFHASALMELIGNEGTDAWLQAVDELDKALHDFSEIEP